MAKSQNNYLRPLPGAVGSEAVGSWQFENGITLLLSALTTTVF